MRSYDQLCIACRRIGFIKIQCLAFDDTDCQIPHARTQSEHNITKPESYHSSKTQIKSNNYYDITSGERDRPVLVVVVFQRTSGRSIRSPPATTSTADPGGHRQLSRQCRRSRQPATVLSHMMFFMLTVYRPYRS